MSLQHPNAKINTSCKVYFNREHLAEQKSSIKLMFSKDLNTRHTKSRQVQCSNFEWFNAVLTIFELDFEQSYENRTSFWCSKENMVVLVIRPFKNKLNCSVLGCHYKYKPFLNGTCFHHLNTRLVRYSDPDCNEAI